MGDDGNDFIKNYMRVDAPLLGNSYATFDHNEFLANIAASQPNYPYTVDANANTPRKDMDYYLAFADKNLFQTQTRVADVDKPDYMDVDTWKHQIKRDMLNELVGPLTKKTVFTSQREFKTFDTVIRGRVYVFNRQELVDLIKECLKV